MSRRILFCLHSTRPLLQFCTSCSKVLPLPSEFTGYLLGYVGNYTHLASATLFSKVTSLIQILRQSLISHFEDNQSAQFPLAHNLFTSLHSPLCYNLDNRTRETLKEESPEIKCLIISVKGYYSIFSCPVFSCFLTSSQFRKIAKPEKCFSNTVLPSMNASCRVDFLCTFHHLAFSLMKSLSRNTHRPTVHELPSPHSLQQLV